MPGKYADAREALRELIFQTYQDAGIPLPPAKRDEIRDKVQTVINTIRDELDDFVGGITRGGAVQERKRRGGRTDEP